MQTAQHALLQWGIPINSFDEKLDVGAIRQKPSDVTGEIAWHVTEWHPIRSLNGH